MITCYTNSLTHLLGNDLTVYCFRNSAAVCMVQRLKVDLMDGFERQLQDVIDDFVREVEDIEQIPSCNGPKKSSKLVTLFN